MWIISRTYIVKTTQKLHEQWELDITLSNKTRTNAINISSNEKHSQLWLRPVNCLKVTHTSASYHPQWKEDVLNRYILSYPAPRPRCWAAGVTKILWFRWALRELDASRGVKERKKKSPQPSPLETAAKTGVYTPVRSPKYRSHPAAVLNVQIVGPPLIALSGVKRNLFGDGHFKLRDVESRFPITTFVSISFYSITSDM